MEPQLSRAGLDVSMGQPPYLRSYRHDEKNPGLGIPKALPHLIRLEMLILDPLAILRNPLDGDDPLPRVEEPRGRGQIRHEGQEHHAPGQADGPEDEKHVLPRRQAGRDVPDGVAQQAADDAGDAVHAVVRHHAQGLLVRPVPHGQA